MTVPAEEGAANYVPAAAVTRRLQALSGFIGRKELVGGLVSRVLKLWAQPGEAIRYCCDLSSGGERGIPSVDGEEDGRVLQITGDSDIGDGHKTEGFFNDAALERLGHNDLDALGQLSDSSVINHEKSV